MEQQIKTVNIGANIEQLDSLIITCHKHEVQDFITNQARIQEFTLGVGGALDRRKVWGPTTSPAGPGQRPVGGLGGRSPPEAHEN